MNGAKVGARQSSRRTTSLPLVEGKKRLPRQVDEELPRKPTGEHVKIRLGERVVSLLGLTLYFSALALLWPISRGNYMNFFRPN